MCMLSDCEGGGEKIGSVFDCAMENTEAVEPWSQWVKTGFWKKEERERERVKGNGAWQLKIQILLLPRKKGCGKVRYGGEGSHN